MSTPSPIPGAQAPSVQPPARSRDDSSAGISDVTGLPPITFASAYEQVDRLRRDGGTYRAIAAAAGLSPSTIHGLATGHRQPTPAIELALRKVTSESITRARVDAGGSRLRLRALHVMGHGSARIARALGVREMTIRRIVRGDAPTVSTGLRDAVTELYDAWWDKRVPQRTRHERAAVTAARRRAIAGNWCAGAGLDDDQLDIPGYRPASGWKHATGTGTAGDYPTPRTRKNTRARTGRR
jgi:hypothetical protein